VVLGPRSAIFAPVARLGLLVVDEEQDPAYKQETTPRYHGRDLALVRARDAGAVALLVSATPSLETRHNAARGKLRALELRSRIGQGELPEGILVDLRHEGPARRPGEVHFSERLRLEITKALATLELRSEEVAIISGIGCSSRIPAYSSCYGFHGVHGRALPVATGLKVARPDLTVIATGGDGDREPPRASPRRARRTPPSAASCRQARRTQTDTWRQSLARHVGPASS